MITTGIVDTVDYVNGTFTAVIEHTGFYSKFITPAWGNNTGGIQYGLSKGDVVFFDNHDEIIFALHPIPNQFNNYPGLKEHDLVIFNAAGASIYLDYLGNITLTPGLDGVIKLAAGTRKVVLDGDSITGTDSLGGAIHGHVLASSTQVTGQ